MRFAADAEFAGENRARGAMISFIANLPDEDESETDEEDAGEDSSADSTAALTENDDADKVRIEILDDGGGVIRTLRHKPDAGINRITWRLDEKGVRYPGTPKPKPDADEPSGARVEPGTYTVRVSFGDWTDSTVVQVNPDPRIDYDDSGMAGRRSMYQRWKTVVATATEAADRLAEARKTIDIVDSYLDEESMGEADPEELKDLGSSLRDSIKVIDEKISGKEVQGIRRDPTTVQSRLSTARSYVLSGFDAPGISAATAMRTAEESVALLIETVNEFFAGTWLEYRSAVDAAELSLFEEYVALEME